MALHRLVLVHGAWQGVGTWDLLIPELETRACRAHAVVLTGLGTDAGSLSGDVTLETHVRDVVRLLVEEDLYDVTLVGHSYAGMIITGAAEQARERIAGLVYIDAFVPDHGQSALTLLPGPFRDAFRAQAAAHGGWRLPAGERQLDLWGLKPGVAREFVRARLSDFSIRCFETPLEAQAGVAGTLPRTYIACVADDYPARVAFEPFAERARRERWTYHELPTGHACQVEMPAALGALLAESATGSG